MKRSYLHQEALTQTGVMYSFFGKEMMIYPLTLRAVNDLNRRVREKYFEKYEESMLLMPESERADFWKAIDERSENLSFQTGDGRTILFSDKAVLATLIRYLCRNSNDWSIERIGEVLSSDVSAPEMIFVIDDMLGAVFREPPEIPKINIPDKPSRYEWTSEERVVQLYTILFSKYHWSFEEVMQLTDYQAVWFAYYVLPGEREHIEDMYNDRPRSGSDGPDVPYQKGALHFNNPEEFEAWKIQKGVS